MKITHMSHTVPPFSEFSIAFGATLQQNKSLDTLYLVPSRWLTPVILTNILGSSGFLVGAKKS